jgi:hypothetical protein
MSSPQPSSPDDAHDPTLDELLRQQGAASTPMLLLVLALLCVLPLAGVGTVLSWAIALLALSWARGAPPPQLPPRLGGFRLGPRWSRRVLRALHGLRWLQGQWFRARLQLLAHPRTALFWAAWIALMAFIIFLPLPLGNVLPALSLVLLALGWMARDGLALLLSAASGAGAIAMLLWLGDLAWAGLQRLGA